MENNNINSTHFTAIIHTLQGTSSDAVLPEEQIRSMPYVRGFCFKNSRAVYRLNPNRQYSSDYEEALYSLQDFEDRLRVIWDELYITEFHINRLDIAVNTTVSYHNLYKMNGYLKELFAVYQNETNSYRTNGDDYRKRSLKVTGRTLDLEVYDKEQESKKRSQWKTRIEFRFKVRGDPKTPLDTIKQLLELLNRLPDCIEALNRKKIDDLYNEYLLERQPDYEGRITALTVFVTKHADTIYNMDILKGLYEKLNTGVCKNWLYRYRKPGRTLTLYKKSDLIAYIVAIRKSLKQYVKGTPKPSPFEGNIGGDNTEKTLNIA